MHKEYPVHNVGREETKGREILKKIFIYLASLDLSHGHAGYSSLTKD